MGTIKHRVTATKQSSGLLKQRGFNITELMIAIAVVAVLATIAAPNMRRFILSNRLTSAANELNAALQGARADAISQNARVKLCPSADGSTCSGSDWRRVAVILHKNGTDTVLRDIDFAGKGIEFAVSSNVSAGNEIWYQSDGFVRTGNSSSPERHGAIGLCVSELPNENARVINFSMSRISVTRQDNTSCAAPSN